MKFAMARFASAAALAFAILPLVALGEQSRGGVQEVIQMLTDMVAKGKKDKQDEQVAFAKFEVWCSQESVALSGDVKKGGEQIEQLTAEVGKLGSDIKGLGDEIAKLRQDEASFSEDLKSEKEQRRKDRTEFEATEKDFSESVDALDRAILTLSQENYDRPAAAAALLQVASSAQMPSEAQGMVASFLEIGQEGPDFEAPEANAYENQSGGLVAMLKKLQDDFREKLGTAQKEEANSQAAHNMVAQDLTDSIENANRDSEQKTKTKERKTAKKASDGKQLKATEDAKAADAKTLSEMKTECSEKKYSFEEKQQLRTEELEALGKAIDILASPDVAGASDKHLSLAQASSAASLVQSGRSTATAKNLNAHRRIRDFLSSEGQRLHSKRVVLLADQIASDPFAKTRVLIESMLTRLMEEQNEDAVHRGFCNTEMGKSKISRNKLNEGIDMLNAAIEDGKSTIIKLSDETAELNKEIESLSKAMGEATQMRNDEHAKNKAAISDAQVAQNAVARATDVLKNFYEKAATATAFLQGGAPQWGVKGSIKMGSDEWNALANPNPTGDSGHKAGMATFGEAEQGQQDAAGGVLGLMEIVMSEFASLEADTKSAEEVASKSHQSFMAESKRNKAAKERKIEMNNSDRVDAESKVQEDTTDLKTTEDQLLAAKRYYEKLVPQCVDKGMTWEERAAAREAEMKSLKEAIKILEQ